MSPLDLCTLADVRDWLNLDVMGNEMPITQIAVVSGGLGYTSLTATVVPGTGMPLGGVLTLGPPILSGGSLVAIPIVSGGKWTVAPQILITGDGTGAVVAAYFSTDAVLSRLITSCSSLMITWMNRKTILATKITEVRNGTGTGRIVLQNWPVISIDSVSIGGTTVQQSDQTRSGWVTDGYSILLNGGGSYGLGYEGLLGYGGVFGKGYQNVQIAYTHGWETIPPELTQACVELVSQRYVRKSHIDQDSVSMGGAAGGTTSFSKGAMPKEVAEICSRYSLLAISEV